MTYQEYHSGSCEVSYLGEGERYSSKLGDETPIASASFSVGILGRVAVNVPCTPLQLSVLSTQWGGATPLS